MQLYLHPYGPPMWYLVGEGINLSLTITSPGPVEVNLNSLSLEHKRYILSSLQGEQIKTDIHLQEVYEVAYPPLELPPVTPEVLPVVQVTPVTPDLPVDLSKVLNEKIEQVNKVVQQKQEMTDKQVNNILKLGAHKIYSRIQQEKDVVVLRLLVDHELQGKKRKSVLGFLRRRIVALQQTKISKIEKTLYQDNYKRSSREPIMEVEESDKEIILLGVNE